MLQFRDICSCLYIKIIKDAYTCMDNSNESEKMDSSDDEVIFVEGNIQQSW